MGMAGRPLFNAGDVSRSSAALSAGRWKCGCATRRQWTGGPPVQRAADEFVSEMGISEEGLEELANIQRRD